MLRRAFYLSVPSSERGCSFVASAAAHPESHNYASVGDLIPQMGLFNLQYLAIRKYEGFKEGLCLEEIISRLAFGDAIKDLDNFDARIIEKYAQERSKYYQEEFKKISNVTVVDSESLWEHSFNDESMSVEKIREELSEIEMSILEDRTNGKFYQLPSKMSQKAKLIYRAIGVKRDDRPCEFKMGKNVVEQKKFK